MSRSLIKLIAIFSICLFCLAPTTLASELTTKPDQVSQAVSTNQTNQTNQISLANSNTKETKLSNQDVKDEDSLPFMKKEKEPEELNGFGLLLRTVGALLLILGLLVVGVWAMRRMGNPRLGLPDSKTPFTVLSTTSIGDKQSVSAVRFGNRILLLGATGNSIRVLASEDCPKEEKNEKAYVVEEQHAPSVGELLKSTREDDDSDLIAQLKHLENQMANSPDYLTQLKNNNNSQENHNNEQYRPNVNRRQRTERID